MKVSYVTAKKFLQGDEEAIGEVYRSYRSLLYFIIASYLKSKDDCEDIYQETFLAILKNRSSLKEPSSLHRYLCETAKNKAIDFARKQSGIESEELFEEEIAAGKETRIDEFLPSDLTYQEKQVVGYRILFGLSFKDISELLNIPIPTLKSRFARAKEKIKGGQ